MPKYYKNWKEITKIISDHRPLGLVLATLDLEKDDKITSVLIETFKDCFSAEEVFAPVPLSVIIEKAEQKGCVSDYDYGYIPVAGGVVPDHIPLIPLGYTDDGLNCSDDVRLPDSVSPDVKIGDFIPWKQKLYVVLENLGWGLITVAPAECILVDC